MLRSRRGPLEAWAAENPHLVISQAFIGGKTVSKAVLETLGAASYGFNHMGDGDRAAVSETDPRQRRLVQMAERLKDVVNPNKADGTSGLLEKDDMPVPTWLVNYVEADSLNYWKSVNKANGASADPSSQASPASQPQVRSSSRRGTPGLPNTQAGSPRSRR